MRAVLVLLLCGCHARLDEAGGGDLSGAADLAEALKINLLGDWSFAFEAQPTTDPSTLVVSNTEDWINVSFSGNGGCGCSSRHLEVTLPHPFACDSTTMTFTWTTGGLVDELHSTSLRVALDPNRCNNRTPGW